MPSKTYKNNADRTIHGIEPGGTGELEDAEAFVGPGALEEVGKAKAEPSEDAPVTFSKPFRGSVGPAE